MGERTDGRSGGRAEEQMYLTDGRTRERAVEWAVGWLNGRTIGQTHAAVDRSDVTTEDGRTDVTVARMVERWLGRAGGQAVGWLPLPSPISVLPLSPSRSLPPRPRHHDTTTPHHDTTTPRHHDTTTPRHHDTTTPHHTTTPTPPHHHTTPHHTRTQTHRNNTTRHNTQHRNNTTTQQQQHNNNNNKNKQQSPPSPHNSHTQQLHTTTTQEPHKDYTTTQQQKQTTTAKNYTALRATRLALKRWRRGRYCPRLGIDSGCGPSRPLSVEFCELVRGGWLQTTRDIVRCDDWRRCRRKPQT